MPLLIVVACLAAAGEPVPASVPSTPGDTSPALAADAPVAAEAPPPLPMAEAPGSSGAALADRIQPQPEFVKGELSVFLGSGRLVTKYNRVGVSAGVDRVGSAYYLLLEPQVDLRFLENRLAIGVGAPLRLELVNFANGSDGQPIFTRNQWSLRKEDYDQPGDFAKLLQYVTYGRKEDRLYVNVGQRYASSIGHGALVRRYAPNIDVDVTRVSAQVDAYNDYAGFELLTNDVVEWNLLSGLAFLKPLSFLSEGLMAKTLSIGVSAAADLRAPRTLSTDPSTGLRLLDANGKLVAERTAVVLAGVDAEVKVVKTEHVDVKPYVDYSLLLGGDGGLTVGALGRFNTGASTVHAFRTVVELRWLGSRYEPGYFDTFYEVERYVSSELPSQVEGIRRYATKYEDVMSAGRPQRIGYYVEGSWGIRDKVGLTLALEGATGTAEKNLVSHLEVPVLSFFQVFGSYYKRSFTHFGELGAFDHTSLLFAGARVKVLPFLFVNGRAFKTFRMNPDVRRYDNSFGFALDVEVGYEFGDDAAASPRS